MSDTAHEVQPGLADTQSGRPLQTDQEEPSPEETSSPNASETIEEVSGVEPQQWARTAAPPELGGDPTPPEETISWLRWEHIKRNIEIEKLLEERKNVCTEEEKAKAWNDVADTVKTCSDDMIERWNKQIDVYLVFAGLFSAILTAFNVQSYPLLQQTTPDPTAAALQQISLQLQSFAISPPFVNSTHPAIAAATILSSTPSPVVQYAIWLNVLWFSGLILSLASTVIGILVKQWLGEYSSGLIGTSREAARLRQYRLNNLVKWRVGGIIVLIPVLLLISLALFLAGLLVLLWNLHPTVAVIASVLVGVLAVSTVCVTLLPIFKPSCAYLSPQTLVLIPLFWHAIFPAAKFGVALVTRVLILPILLPSVMLFCFIKRCLLYLQAPRRQGWGYLVRFHDVDIEDVPGFVAVNNLLNWFTSDFHWSESIPTSLTWRGHERSVVNRLNKVLDIDILINAYDSTLDANAASCAAVCLLEQPSDAVVDYSSRLQCCVAEHFGYIDAHLDSYPKNNLLAGQTLLCVEDVMGSYSLPDFETVHELYWAFDRSCAFGVVPSTGLSVQSPAQDAWLRSVASSKTIRGLSLENQGYGKKFLSHFRQAIQEPMDEKVQENLEDTGHSRSRDIDILRRRTERCLRLVTAPHVVQGTVVDYTSDTYFHVYVDYLCSVEEYLGYAARALRSSAEDVPGLEDSDSDVIRKTTLDILLNFASILYCEHKSGTARCRKGLFKHAYVTHLSVQHRILYTLNSEHEIFRSIGFDGLPCFKLLLGFRGLFSWAKQHKHARVAGTDRPSPEDMDAALARYNELYRPGIYLG